MGKNYLLLLALLILGANQLNAQCSAAFTYDTSQEPDVFFTADVNDPNWTYDWDFGDGNFGTGATAIHTYDSSATYYVCLSVFDGVSCYDIFCDSVTVILPAPSCNASFIANVNAGTAFFIANPGFMPGWSYTWDFGDGNFGTGSFTQHVYTASEEYLVCLTVYDSLTTCTYTTCELVDVDINCTASFFATTDNLTVTFLGQPIGFGNTYIWSFGDMQFATTQLPFTSHTYNTPGTYNVCMNVTTASGSNCTFCDQVVVTLPPAGIKYNSVEFELNLFPNPAKDFITLTISGTLSNIAEMQMLDYTGRIISSEQINLHGNQNMMILPVNKLQSGAYFIRLIHEGNSKTLRFVKQ